MPSNFPTNPGIPSTLAPDRVAAVERAIEEVRAGRIVILVDDEDRENEGDLFVAAERASPEAINFMATHGRGLISLALTEERTRALGLSLITDDSGNKQTANVFPTCLHQRATMESN